MPNLKIVTRDYRHLYSVLLLWRVDAQGLGAHGVHFDVSKTTMTSSWKHGPTEELEGTTYPSIREAASTGPTSSCSFATETNGEMAYRGYQYMEEQDGPAVDGPGRGEPQRPGSATPTSRPSPETACSTAPAGRV